MEKNIEQYWMTENYCDGCDFVVHQVFNKDDFCEHKVGAVKCPECGTVIMPCNECDEESQDCDNCPWKNSVVSDDMSDKEYVEWYKKILPEIFKMMADGELGEGYQEIAKSLQ